MTAPTRDHTPSPDGASPRSPLDGLSQPAWRRWLRPVRTRSVLLPALAAIVSGVLFLVTTAGNAETARILVADRDLPAGTVITMRDLRVEEVPASEGVTDRVLSADDLDEGMVVSGPIAKGDPVLEGSVLSGGDAERAISVPVPRTRAVGGDIRVGHRVDIITVDKDGTARYVLRNAPVLEVPSTQGGDGVLTNTGNADWYLTVAVPDSQAALAVAEAVESGTVQVIRVPPGDDDIEAVETQEPEDPSDDEDTVDDPDTGDEGG